MTPMTVMPAVLTQRFVNGATITGVTPSGTSYSFGYDNEAGGPFTVGEALSWGAGGTAGTGILSSTVDDGATGSMVILLSTGVIPSDDVEITGTDSSATCDVDGDVTEVPYSDTLETLHRGRVRKLGGLVDGGLVDTNGSVLAAGYRVQQAMATLPGITALNFYVVDHDGHDTFVGSVSLTTGNGYLDWRNNGVFVPPRSTFKVVGTGTLSADGQITLVFGQGWIVSMFDGMAVLGKENRV